MNRFDLEQDILKCWGIVDDLALYQKFYDVWSEDDRLNFISGLSVKYHALFNQTFETFSQSLHEFKTGL